jgi:hypothetical protein
VWIRSNGANTIIQGAVRPTGGAWQPAVNLSADGESAFEPQVAVDAAGNAATVWKRYDGTRWLIQAATRPASGAWQPEVNLSAEGQSASEPEVALDRRGDAVAVWEHYDGSNGIIQGGSYDAAGQGKVTRTSAQRVAGRKE